ncbi:Zinc finger protein 70 [Fasciola gigantica]|uniref:Zinc finger protein 70 n=1 Tax=Fasciola gigantica TaxID=46835 RepID=A0A504Z149_FASGI|nr:Zinc finger protein 70 [Fasciola gigantica]
MNGLNSLLQGALNQSAASLTQPEVVQAVQKARYVNQPCAVQARTCCSLIPDEARKPDRSVLQHAAEQLWSKLKVDATSVTGLDCSLATCSTNTTTTTANTACQPRTILANLFIITTEKSIFPTSSSIVTNPSGSTFPIRFGILTHPTSSPTKPCETTEKRASDVEFDRTFAVVNDGVGADGGSSPTTAEPVALVTPSTSGSPLSSYPSSSSMSSASPLPFSLSSSSSSLSSETASLPQSAPTVEVTRTAWSPTESPPASMTVVKTEVTDSAGSQLTESKSDRTSDQSVDSPGTDSQPTPTRTGQYTCFTCRQHFQSHTGLKRHNLALHVTQILPCDQCVKVFRHPNALADHKKRVHGPREYVCGVCSADFATESYLRTHVRIHEEKQFCCAECKHCFSNHTDLKNHMRVHNGEKPFTCEVCGKSFRHVSGFYAHIRIHTGETPYNCEQCDKKFSNASNYRMHMKVHTKEMRFRCETCGKEFIQPSNYSRHLRIHTKERPYACNLCSAQFPYSTSLKRHQQRDHGVDLLSCRVCSKTFLNETSLVRHRTGCELRACVTTTGAELCAQLL